MVVMRRTTSLLALFSLLSIATFPLAAEDEPNSIGQALKAGKPTVQLRLRFESVDDDALEKEASALTLRSVLAYRSGVYKGWSVFAEAENVTAVGDDSYNNRGAGSLSNGVTDRPVVADPALTEINQASLRYQNDDWKLTLGRQELVLGDSRFVGNVGWRQNHQSFDALRVENSALDKVKFDYAFLDQVHRIFGDSLDLAGHSLSATIDAGAVGKVTLYGLLLDYEDIATAGLSTATYGAQLAGKRELNEGPALLYEVELAQQSDHADNAGNVDAGYNFLMFGASWPKVTARIGREVLEGSAADGRFLTPLATLHKFNGWADKFLATPATGLEDFYLQLNGKIGGVDWLVSYHEFKAESVSATYGSELDLQLLHKCKNGLVVALKGMLYDADTFSTDAEKVAIWAAYSF